MLGRRELLHEELDDLLPIDIPFRRPGTVATSKAIRNLQKALVERVFRTVGAFGILIHLREVADEG